MPCPDYAILSCLISLAAIQIRFAPCRYPVIYPEHRQAGGNHVVHRGHIMSLRDQLLKAGLVSQEEASKVDADARKQAHKAKKDKTASAAEATREAQARRSREAEAERKRERDRELNREREAQKKRKEATARARQLIESNRLNEAEAEIRYNFLMEGRYIRSVRVTHQQQKHLAMGRIGIARNAANPYDFPLIPREVALKLAEFCPEDLLLLYPESNSPGEEADDWDV